MYPLSRRGPRAPATGPVVRLPVGRRRGGAIAGHSRFPVPGGGRRIWVLDLDPIGAPAGPVRPVAALGDDAFEPDGARMLEHRRAVAALEVFGYPEPLTAAAKQPCQGHPAVIPGTRSQVLPVKLDHVKGKEEGCPRPTTRVRYGRRPRVPRSHESRAPSSDDRFCIPPTHSKENARNPGTCFPGAGRRAHEQACGPCALTP